MGQSRFSTVGNQSLCSNSGVNTENTSAISIQADLYSCMAIPPSFLHKGWESMCKISEIKEAEIVRCSGKISNPSLLHSCQSRSDDSDGMKTKQPPKITSRSSSIILWFVYKWSRSPNPTSGKKWVWESFRSEQRRAIVIKWYSVSIHIQFLVNIGTLTARMMFVCLWQLWLLALNTGSSTVQLSFFLALVGKFFFYLIAFGSLPVYSMVSSLELCECVQEGHEIGSSSDKNGNFTSILSSRWNK